MEAVYIELKPKRHLSIQHCLYAEFQEDINTYNVPSVLLFSAGARGLLKIFLLLMPSVTFTCPGLQLTAPAAQVTFNGPFVSL